MATLEEELIVPETVGNKNFTIKQEIPDIKDVHVVNLFEIEQSPTEQSIYGNDQNLITEMIAGPRVNSNAILDLFYASDDSGDDDITILSEEEKEAEEEEAEDSNSSDDDVNNKFDVADFESADNLAGWTIYGDKPNFQRTEFTASPGFKAPLVNKPESVLNFFMLFFTEELVNAITNETNRYARDKLANSGPQKSGSLWKNWVDISEEEMKAFIGVLINMAMNPRPNIQEYFSQDWLDKCAFYKDVFNRIRFQQIFWMLHLSPQQIRQPNCVFSSGSNIQNIAQYVDEKFREYYVPDQNVCVDVSTFGFKGRVKYKNYNPMKHANTDMRIYVLSESKTGYIVAFQPYYGHRTTETLPRPELPFRTRIVMHLCDKLVNSTNGAKGYHIYTESFYTSYELAIQLLNIGFHLTGTVSPHSKKLPKSVRKNDLKLKTHEVESYRKDDQVLLLAWKDKDIVFMLSTWYNNETESVSRMSKGHVTEVFQKPTVVSDYNTNIGGANIASQYTGTYSFARKSLNGWRKLFFWLLEVGIVNSLFLYNLNAEANQRPKLSQRKYRKELVRQLVGEIRDKPGRKRGRLSSTDEEERLNGKIHFVYRNEKGSTKDCAVCSDRKTPGGRKETVYNCNTCTRKPGLHPGRCFEMYHTLKKFK